MCRRPAAEELVAGGGGGETPAAGVAVSIVGISDDTSAEVDPEMQRRMEMATELSRRLKLFEIVRFKVKR